jgi:hypothetical protein
MEMIESKKGDGLSMNVIIIAILALIVLVVLVLIFMKQMDKTTTQTDAICTLEAVGARCVNQASELPNAGAGYTQITGKKFTDCPAPKGCYKLS